ncbi:MAG: DUF2326 domain-containing protein [Magnetococcales bacterium]|nr:DUF2326 domain-containing protein [Magnetococcales bacterium]
MIHNICCDLRSFKTLSFRKGLNILLAEKSAGASDRQTRNAAGKSSFIELVHLLLGSNVEKTSIFKSEELSPWTFQIELDICDEVYTIHRSGAKPSKIIIQGDPSVWPISPSIDDKTGFQELSNTNWKLVLGNLFFGLPYHDIGRFKPTVRSLFPYFARRQEDGGFEKIVKHSSQQSNWAQQVGVSYLLDLDWTISQQFQEIREKEKATEKLRKAAKDGELGHYIGRSSDLRTQLTISEAKAKRLRSQLDSYQVVPEYKELESEASNITRQISNLNGENVIDRELLLQLKESYDAETPPDNGDVSKLYNEAGIVFPDLVKHRLEEVTKFHQVIVQNRRAHLSNEITSTEERISERDRQKESLDERRKTIMEILDSGGALEHYTRLREELGKSESEVETLKQRMETAEKIESTKADLEIERATLSKTLKNDIRERESIVREAILLFEELSESLYEQAGSLTISDSHNGPVFEVKKHSQRSKGINNMQIFCFDLMLTELSLKQGRGPGFLIHDSHLFDGVDPRQVAKALQLGADRAEAHGYQYIVTMNSNELPKNGFRPGMDIKDYILPTKLTDATETGGLFGLRFD